MRLLHVTAHDALRGLPFGENRGQFSLGPTCRRNPEFHYFGKKTFFPEIDAKEPRCLVACMMMSTTRVRIVAGRGLGQARALTELPTCIACSALYEVAQRLETGAP